MPSPVMLNPNGGSLNSTLLAGLGTSTATRYGVGETVPSMIRQGLSRALTLTPELAARISAPLTLFYTDSLGMPGVINEQTGDDFVSSHNMESAPNGPWSTELIPRSIDLGVPGFSSPGIFQGPYVNIPEGVDSWIPGYGSPGISGSIPGFEVGPELGPPLMSRESEYGVTESIEVYGARAIDRAVPYQEGVHSLYNGLSPGPSSFTYEEADGRISTRYPDQSVYINGESVAIDAKYVDDWTTSPSNPDSFVSALNGGSQVNKNIAQAIRYSDTFDQIVYHTNSRAFADYYSKAFSDASITNIKFVITPASVRPNDR